ncbi:MAG: hypothetical protein RhofKO_29660 [Rhodothermales bacterium]
MFDPNAELNEIILGDTLHPPSGFINEKILNGTTKISELLEFDYDFKGLVEFEAKIGTMKVQLLYSDTDEYLIQGEAREIDIFKNKIIEANAYQQNRYHFSSNVKWKN